LFTIGNGDTRSGAGGDGDACIGYAIKGGTYYKWERGEDITGSYTKKTTSKSL
jgi:hypothetical protein